MAKQLYKKKVTAPATALKEEQLQVDGKQVNTQEPESPLLPPTFVSRPLALSDLPLDMIVPNPFQARTTFDPDRLQDLANAMKEHGIISRIRVRKAPTASDDEERYELVYGERRWRAAKLAGMTHYPVEIVAHSDDEMVEIGLLENVQREDLTPLEEAQMYQRLLDQVDEEGQHRYSIRKLADRLGKHKSYIELRLAVLRSPEDVRNLVEDHPDTPLRAAFEIAKVADQTARETLITDVREGKLQKVEEVKARVRQVTGKHSIAELPPTASASVLSDQLASLPAHQIAQQNMPSSQEMQEVSDKPLRADINSAPDSAEGLLLFEQQLQDDSKVISAILHRLTTKIETMNGPQREVLILYIDQWENALSDLKTNAQR